MCKRGYGNEDGRRPKLRQLLLRFPMRFLQGYLLRLGFLDGLAGLQVCALVAYLSWLKQAYLWQLQARHPKVDFDRHEIEALNVAAGNHCWASQQWHPFARGHWRASWTNGGAFESGAGE